jgi:hypothetical protein
MLSMLVVYLLTKPFIFVVFIYYNYNNTIMNNTVKVWKITITFTTPFYFRTYIL